jgi:hypothetical protein
MNCIFALLLSFCDTKLLTFENTVLKKLIAVKKGYKVEEKLRVGVREQKPPRGLCDWEHSYVRTLNTKTVSQKSQQA